MKRSSTSEGGDHDDGGAGADFIVNEFFDFLHLLSVEDKFELVSRHAFFVLNVFLEHFDSVVFFVVAGEFPVGDSFDFEVWHLKFNYLMCSFINHMTNQIFIN